MIYSRRATSLFWFSTLFVRSFVRSFLNISSTFLSRCLQLSESCYEWRPLILRSAVYKLLATGHSTHQPIQFSCLWPAFFLSTFYFFPLLRKQFFPIWPIFNAQFFMLSPHLFIYLLCSTFFSLRHCTCSSPLYLLLHPFLLHFIPTDSMHFCRVCFLYFASILDCHHSLLSTLSKYFCIHHLNLYSSHFISLPGCA